MEYTEQARKRRAIKQNMNLMPYLFNLNIDDYKYALTINPIKAIKINNEYLGYSIPNQELFNIILANIKNYKRNGLNINNIINKLDNEMHLTKKQILMLKKEV